MSMSDVTMEVPTALSQLIINNNEALKIYQSQLMNQIRDANNQMMQILKLDSELGWRLDMERMLYVKTTIDAPLSTEK